jgi:hypothetical protein
VCVRTGTLGLRGGAEGALSEGCGRGLWASSFRPQKTRVLRLMLPAASTGSAAHLVCIDGVVHERPGHARGVQWQHHGPLARAPGGRVAQQRAPVDGQPQERLGLRGNGAERGRGGLGASRRGMGLPAAPWVPCMPGAGSRPHTGAPWPSACARGSRRMVVRWALTQKVTRFISG